MSNTSRSIIYSFLQIPSTNIWAPISCQELCWARAPTSLQGAFAYIGTGQHLWAGKLGKLAPGLQMNT